MHVHPHEHTPIIIMKEIDCAKPQRQEMGILACNLEVIHGDSTLMGCGAIPFSRQRGGEVFLILSRLCD